jgi:hypothetical protein
MPRFSLVCRIVIIGHAASFSKTSDSVKHVFAHNFNIQPKQQEQPTKQHTNKVCSIAPVCTALLKTRLTYRSIHFLFASSTDDAQ